MTMPVVFVTVMFVAMVVVVVVFVTVVYLLQFPFLSEVNTIIQISKMNEEDMRMQERRGREG